MVGHPRSEYPPQCGEQSALLRMQRRSVVDGASGRLSHAAFSDAQAQALELGGNVRKGERGTKVYFVKQLQVRDQGDDSSSTRLIPMMREYTVFNVDQCQNLPDSIGTGKPIRIRNPDTRDGLAEKHRCAPLDAPAPGPRSDWPTAMHECRRVPNWSVPRRRRHWPCLPGWRSSASCRFPTFH
jgi:hypothetical protein